MAERSFLWNTNGTGDGTLSGYTVANMAELFQIFNQGAIKAGVAPDRDNELAVTGVASPISVASGSAIVHGTAYVNTSPVAVVIPTPVTSTRQDAIVLRKSWAAQTIRVTRIAGTEGAGIPTAITTDGTTWDLVLAYVTITTGGTITIQDVRPWLSLVGNGRVITAKLADLAVTLAKLADAAVSTAKLVDLSVTNAKLAAGVVTSAKVGNGEILQAKLGTDTLRTLLIDMSPQGAVTTASLTYGSFLGAIQGAIAFNPSKLPAGRTVKLAVAGNVTAGGSGEAQIWNATGGVAIPSSEVSWTGALPFMVVGPSMTFPAGDAMYDIGIQIKRTGGSTATLHRAYLLVEW